MSEQFNQADELENQIKNYYVTRYGEAPDPLKDWSRIQSQLTSRSLPFRDPGKKNGFKAFFHSKPSLKGFQATPKFGRAYLISLGMVIIVLLMLSVVIVAALSVNLNSDSTQSAQSTPLPICPGLSSLECAYRQSDEVKQILEQNLGQELNLSKTDNGYTVTIKRMYADHKHIVIGYTISGSGGGFNYNPGAIATLKDENGNPLGLLGSNYGGVTNQVAAEVKWFNSPLATENSPSLKVTFQVGPIIVNSLLSADPHQSKTVTVQKDARIVQSFFVFDFMIPVEKN